MPGPKTPTTSSALAAVLAFRRGTDDRMAEEVVPAPFGSILRATTMPSGRVVNALRVEHGRPVPPAAELAEVAAAELAHAWWLHVAFEDPAAAAETVAGLLAAGWEAERTVLMLLEAVPPPAPGEAELRDGTEDELLELGERWQAEGGDSAYTTPEGVEQLRRMHVREGRAWPERRLVAGPPGAAVAKCRLRRGDGVAQVEDVYVVPEARGRGLGRALVSRAAREAAAAGPGPIFIEAEADDWPKDLYARLGFRAAAELVSVRRDWLGATQSSSRRPPA